MKKTLAVLLTLLVAVFASWDAGLAEEKDVILSDDASDFVLVSEAVPDAILEIRYYSTYNFVGDRIDGYEEPLALLTKEAAAALREVSDELVDMGYRLKIFDAYRPQMAVTHFMRWALDPDDMRMKEYFYPELDKDVLFPQGYIAEHSGHSRGSTVDLTLFDMTTEKEVDMGGTFDYFGELSHPDYTGVTEEQYANRMLLRDVMVKHGFKPLVEEWWHFTLENEPFPETYFTFPVNSDSLPASVDYACEANWAYFGIGEDRDADVFLVCPTVDMNDEFNMSLEDADTKASFLGALNMERGIYEDAARLYAPYYRQAAMKVYDLDAAGREPYMEIAYRDISAAFAWYLEHENQGRPIILAGFSQGADMCYRLLAEYFDDAELYDQLVAVYALGWPCTEELESRYPQIRPAQSADDLGVVISFDCEAPEVTETFINPVGQRAFGINPLSWRTDEAPADKSENAGACFTNYSGEIVREEAGLCGCYLDTERGVVKVTDLDPAEYPPIVPGLPDGGWHVYDYQFFYRNLQENVRARTEGYLTESALDRVLRRGVLRVGATGDYNPMNYLDPDTGEYWGFDVALAEDLAASLGVEIEYVPTSWPTLTEDTLAGKFDLALCGITITEARKETMLMSDGYLGNGKTILCRAEEADRYTSLEDINRPEVRVMVNPGGLNEQFALENLPDATLIVHDVNQEIPGLVASGEADIMITETMEAGYYVGQDDRLAAPLIYEPFTNGQLGALMPKGSEDLLDYVNAFLLEGKGSGRIDELAGEYIYRYIEREETLEPAA